MIRPLLLALWLVWSACGNTPKADQTAERQAGADTVVTILTTSDEGDEAPWWTKLGLPQPDTLIVPAETADLPGVEIMPTGSFHGDEIDELLVLGVGPDFGGVTNEDWRLGNRAHAA